MGTTGKNAVTKCFITGMQVQPHNNRNSYSYTLEIGDKPFNMHFSPAIDWESEPFIETERHKLIGLLYNGIWFNPARVVDLEDIQKLLIDNKDNIPETAKEKFENTFRYLWSKP